MIVSTEGRSVPSVVHSARRNPVFPAEGRLIVLIDERSASASEIVRPGKPTVDYLTKMLNYIIFIGAAGLTIVAVIPFFFNGVFGANVSFGGTSIIIIVGVILETLKQIESMMLVRNYKGFLDN